MERRSLKRVECALSIRDVKLVVWSHETSVKGPKFYALGCRQRAKLWRRLWSYRYQCRTVSCPPDQATIFSESL